MVKAPRRRLRTRAMNPFFPLSVVTSASMEKVMLADVWKQLTFDSSQVTFASSVSGQAGLQMLHWLQGSRKWLFLVLLLLLAFTCAPIMHPPNLHTGPCPTFQPVCLARKASIDITAEPRLHVFHPTNQIQGPARLSAPRFPCLRLGLGMLRLACIHLILLPPFLLSSSVEASPGITERQREVDGVRLLRITTLSSHVYQPFDQLAHHQSDPHPPSWSHTDSTRIARLSGASHASVGAATAITTPLNPSRCSINPFNLAHHQGFGNPASYRLHRHIDASELVDLAHELIFNRGASDTLTAGAASLARQPQPQTQAQASALSRQRTDPGNLELLWLLSL